MTYQINNAELEAEIYLRQNIIGKLHAGQQELRNKYINSAGRKLVFNCSRRFGKSTLLAAIAIEHCWRNPKARVVFAAPTRAQAKDIILPIMRELIGEAPELMSPAYRVQDMMYKFSNGAEIHIDGADDEQGNHLRGSKATLVLADEAGFWRHCEYVINSILLPQTITCDGRIIIASTPPQSVGHEFMHYVDEAIKSDSYVKKTIYDNPMLTQSLIDEYARESGGEKATAFRREYLCEFVTETERAVIPEFNTVNHVIADYKRPDFWDSYVLMDLGLVDFTHVLFGFYDFEKAKLIIEDEIVQNYKTTSDLATAIKAKESELWPRHPPTQRISDNELQQLTDLSITHGLNFVPAQKYDKEAAINQLRLMFQKDKIQIHERCKVLIHQLKVGIWNKARSDYERIPGAGHLDGIDALKYGVRLIDFNRNPVPLGYGVSQQTHHIPRAHAEKHPFERLVTWHGRSQ